MWYAKFFFYINAVILFHVHQVLLLYIYAFAQHFACTCIRIHFLCFKNVDFDERFIIQWFLNNILFRMC